MCRRLLSLLMTAALLLAMTGCGSPQAKIERLNERLCDSYNHGDLEGVLDCFEPDLAQGIRMVVDAGIGLFGALTDVELELDSEDMFALVKTCFDLMPEEELSALGMPVLEMELTALEFNEEQTYAVGDVIMRLSVGDQTEAYAGRIAYIFEDGEWYLGYSDFNP